ncbi:merozoite surface protein 3, putative [Plasmodium malariae]|uniref:S-antigen protein n=1 Tax=Plasmodium malariae TaxID=5858 RepID=A0A1D3JJX0_PLAMA|nr:merozoite surface protein 3, putative [Plasmodium malariae]SBT86739.1 merozoite surface protein 3, putative [Plasmodium malariae]
MKKILNVTFYALFLNLYIFANDAKLIDNSPNNGYINQKKYNLRNNMPIKNISPQDAQNNLEAKNSNENNAYEGNTDVLENVHNAANILNKQKYEEFGDSNTSSNFAKSFKHTHTNAQLLIPMDPQLQQPTSSDPHNSMHTVLGNDAEEGKGPGTAQEPINQPESRKTLEEEEKDKKVLSEEQSRTKAPELPQSSVETEGEHSTTGIEQPGKDLSTGVDSPQGIVPPQVVLPGSDPSERTVPSKEVDVDPPPSEPSTLARVPQEKSASSGPEKKEDIQSKSDPNSNVYQKEQGLGLTTDISVQTDSAQELKEQRDQSHQERKGEERPETQDLGTLSTNEDPSGEPLEQQRGDGKIKDDAAEDENSATVEKSRVSEGLSNSDEEAQDHLPSPPQEEEQRQQMQQLSQQEERSEEAQNKEENNVLHTVSILPGESANILDKNEEVVEEKEEHIEEDEEEEEEGRQKEEMNVYQEEAETNNEEEKEEDYEEDEIEEVVGGGKKNNDSSIGTEVRKILSGEYDDMNKFKTITEISIKSLINSFDGNNKVTNILNDLVKDMAHFYLKS